jgi:pimeloyl-ACP methyl ester carboxylesterase
MPTARREIIWLHALHGYLRGPEDFEELAHALEAPLLYPPSDPGSLNWTLEKDVELNSSVRLRLVAWDLRSWLASETCTSLARLSELFLQAMDGVLLRQDARTKSKGGASKSLIVERHVLLGEGLGARVILKGLVEQIRRFEKETHLAQGAPGRKRHLPDPPRLPWERIILLGAHPGLVDARDREARIELEHQWASRILHEPLDGVREAWFTQSPYSTSPGLLKNLHSEVRAWKPGLSAARLASITEGFLLGRQEDYREELKRLGVFGEGVRFLWVAGERDRKFISILHELQELNVPGEFWMCPNAGHAVYLDSPIDLAEKIRFFLV